MLEHAVGADNAARFAVFAGDIVPAKKPDPAIYTLALERLSLAPGDAIVIEDSRNGLLAAVGAGLRCVVTVSSYTDRGGHERGRARRHEPRRSRRPGGGAGQSWRRRARRAGHARRSRRVPNLNPYSTRRLYERERAGPRRVGRAGDRPDRGRQRDVLLRARRRRRRRRLRLLARARLRGRARRLGRDGVQRRRPAC